MGYPGLVTCGPERVGTGATPTGWPSGATPTG